MKCTLLDVFSRTPFGGNGLAVFEPETPLTSDQMLAYTRELRQFESIFFTRSEQPNHVSARIFTMEEELDFAGHPLLGLAAHLHSERGTRVTENWQISLNSGRVSVSTDVCDYSGQTPEAHLKPSDHNAPSTYFHATMHQGAPTYIKQLPGSAQQEVLEALNLRTDNLADLPMEVISTGLPYLIVPLTHGLAQARITHPQFESLLSKHGAQFVYVLDIEKNEGRTWDNLGQVEDIATGSAAGPAAAYLWKHHRVDQSNRLSIAQGRFMHRPSTIEIQLDIAENSIRDILVGGGCVWCCEAGVCLKD